MAKILNALMLANVGKWDRVLRVILGITLLSLVLTGQTDWGWLGSYPLLTGLFAVSPLYAILGINTHRRSRT